MFLHTFYFKDVWPVVPDATVPQKLILACHATLPLPANNELAKCHVQVS